LRKEGKDKPEREFEGLAAFYKVQIEARFGAASPNISPSGL
jgi:hypothetical protein